MVINRKNSHCQRRETRLLMEVKIRFKMWINLILMSFNPFKMILSMTLISHNKTVVTVTMLIVKTLYQLENHLIKIESNNSNNNSNNSNIIRLVI